MMSSIVSNQYMIREWSDRSEPSWDFVGSPRWIEIEWHDTIDRVCGRVVYTSRVEWTRGTIGPSARLVDTQRTRQVPIEGLSPRVDRPIGLRMMSSVVLNQDIIREWSDMSETSWGCVGSPRWIKLANCTTETWYGNA
ncbi:hypothetical protein HAX54_032803 [Datura stramonium]|uniref:Uncharacterized protein n=1 Tax=Datura stramonium TaxID=4076 RepID=A0ABS8VEE5_DATST|nr:hypothetical protein [Datura stramonium]